MPKSRRTLFDPNSTTPFQLSRYRLERFLDCPRCFWLDLRKGVKRPEPRPYTLNNAVDLLVKQDFDRYRLRKEPHPIMTRFGIDGMPFNHPKLAAWRLTTKGKGMRFRYPKTTLDIMGAPDDIWLVRSGGAESLAIVDTKATSAKEIHPIGDQWWTSYRRQLDVYAWLLARQNTGYAVARTGYFLLLNGMQQTDAFAWHLSFEPAIIAYETNAGWVSDAIEDAYACLTNDLLPVASLDCDYCAYRRIADAFES